jgi:electron transport complex protein RnfB
MSPIVIVLVLAVALSIIIALILSFASEAFYVYEDPRLQDLITLLPLANCGQCGNPGCKGMAESILAEESKLTSCKPGNQEMRDAIKEYLETHPNEDGEYTKVKM